MLTYILAVYTLRMYIVDIKQGGKTMEILHSVDAGDMTMYVTYDLFYERFNVCVKRYGHGDDWVYFYKSYKTIKNAIAAGMKRMPKS